MKVIMADNNTDLDSSQKYLALNWNARFKLEC